MVGQLQVGAELPVGQIKVVPIEGIQMEVLLVAERRTTGILKPEFLRVRTPLQQIGVVVDKDVGMLDDLRMFFPE